jgi:ribonuclease HI
MHGNSRVGTDVWVAYVDGSVAPSPGTMAVAYVLTSPRGVRHEYAAKLGQGCNTEAEARAVLACVEAAVALGARQLRVHCDNLEVIEHAHGAAVTTVARLACVYATVISATAQLDRFELRYVPRASNREADALARAALGLKPRAR